MGGGRSDSVSVSAGRAECAVLSAECGGMWCATECE